jgi:hypothetical protein
VTAQQVQATEPILRTNQTPDPPPDIPAEEWSRMLREVGLFGSPDVSKAMNEFRDKVSDFSGNLAMYRILRDQNEPVGETGKAMHNARGEVTRAYERLAKVMNDELANL